jgi:predicted transcriptional regulator
MVTNNTEPQQKILELLKQKPGLHLSKIAELLNINISDVQQILHQLEKQRLISITDNLGFTQYFVKTQTKRWRSQKTQETRNKIYDIINQNPGIYTSKIAELMGMSTQLTDYHLLYLERKKIILATKDPIEYYRKYYTVESTIRTEDKKLLDLLSKRISFEILMLLLKHDSLQHKDLAKKLNMSPSKLSYHLSKLESDNAIIMQPYGETKGYHLKNKDEIVRILRIYQKRITLSLAVDEFRDIWNDFQFK